MQWMRTITKRTIAIYALTALILVSAAGIATAQPAAPPDVSAATDVVAAPLEGDAAIPTKSLLGVLKDGGLLMIPIGICSFVLLVFVFERAISLRRGRVIPRPFVRRFLEQLREEQLTRDEAMRLCEENSSPVS